MNWMLPQMLAPESFMLADCRWWRPKLPWQPQRQRQGAGAAFSAELHMP